MACSGETIPSECKFKNLIDSVCNRVTRDNNRLFGFKYSFNRELFEGDSLRCSHLLKHPYINLTVVFSPL